MIQDSRCGLDSTDEHLSSRTEAALKVAHVYGPQGTREQGLGQATAGESGHREYNIPEDDFWSNKESVTIFKSKPLCPKHAAGMACHDPVCGRGFHHWETCCACGYIIEEQDLAMTGRYGDVPMHEFCAEEKY